MIKTMQTYQRTRQADYMTISNYQKNYTTSGNGKPTLYPDLNTINNLNPKPTAGELYLIKFLFNNLDQNYEIFFQPYINTDRPDIVVIRKNSGVVIFEVKDWNLSNYNIHEKYWQLKSNNQKNSLAGFAGKNL